MLEVWISHVEAPETVNPDEPFKIKYKVWYLTGITYKEFRLFSYITNLDGTVANFADRIFPQNYWGCVNKTINISGISKETAFTIHAGYEETETVYTA